MAVEGVSARRYWKAGESYWGRIISAVERHSFGCSGQKALDHMRLLEYVLYRKRLQLS